MQTTTAPDARSISLNLSPRELATILAGLSLRDADLSGTTGEPIHATSGDVDDLATAADTFDALDVEELDELIERLSALEADNFPPESPVALLKAFAATFGRAVDDDEEIAGGDAVDWLTEFLPRVTRTLAAQDRPDVAQTSAA